jgi:hypothetical protein
MLEDDFAKADSMAARPAAVNRASGFDVVAASWCNAEQPWRLPAGNEKSRA